MKILMIGTGGLGCFYGGKIAHLGGDITFLSRGKSFEVIKEKGITVTSEVEESFHTFVKLIDRFPANLHYDLVIIATKSYDVQTLVDQLPESLLSSSYFMTLQNGLMSEDILSEKLEPTRLLPATAFVALKKSEANVVKHTAGGRFQFGAYSRGQREDFMDDLVELFERCQIDTHFSENIVKMKWGKLVWNAAYNPLSTITRLKLGNIITNPYGVTLLRASMEETASIAEKAGYPLSDEFIEKQMNLPKDLYNFTTSMLQDFMNGKPLEIEAILGDLIRKGKTYGVPTPTHDHFYPLIQILLQSRDHPMKE